MSEFDSRAREWDNNPINWERSEAISKSFLEMIPVNSNMKALEYGAGTGILSFLLSEIFSEITLMDNSEEMVKVMHEKVSTSKLKNLKPLLFDLEHTNYHALKFDCIFSQMVMHHVPDVDAMLNKFYGLLNPGGFLAIADLYTEDGSFHGPEVKVHWGFEPSEIAHTMKVNGFISSEFKTCFVMKRPNGREYPIFLLKAKKQS